MSLRIEEAGDAAGIAAAERVHRQLRPAMPAGYVAKMQRVIAGGARMLVALEGRTVLGVAVYRIFEDTFNGTKLYVDDLVTDEARRSSGVGHALLAHIAEIGRAAGADVMSLDSGTQRQQAHKFYFREGLTVSSFNFKKPLK